MTEFENLANKLAFAKNNNLILKPRIECTEYSLMYFTNKFIPGYCEITKCELLHSFLFLNVNINEPVIIKDEKEKIDFYRVLQENKFKKNESTKSEKFFSGLNMKSEDIYKFYQGEKKVIFE